MIASIFLKVNSHFPLNLKCTFSHTTSNKKGYRICPREVWEVLLEIEKSKHTFVVLHSFKICILVKLHI